MTITGVTDDHVGSITRFIGTTLGANGGTARITVPYATNRTQFDAGYITNNITVTSVLLNGSAGPTNLTNAKVYASSHIPTIFWSNPSNITYGTALSSTQLNATASVNGTFNYDPPSGTVLSIGTHTLSIIFTPTDTANYTTATKNVSTNVTPATLPIAQFTANTTTGNAPLTVQFTDTSTGSPTSWNWSFGDGTYATQQNPVHTYSTAGNYQVRMTAINSAGQSKSKPTKITVDSATATPPDQGAGLTIIKSASPMSYDAIGQTITYTYTVKNIGNVDLTGLQIIDDKFGSIKLSATSLAPNAQTTGTATYITTQHDLDAGYVTNLATATGLFNGKKITSNNDVGSFSMNMNIIKNIQPMKEILDLTMGVLFRHR